MKLIYQPKFEYLKKQLQSIPAEFESSGELIYQARNQLKKYSFENEQFVVKSFKRPHIFNRVAYTFLRKSKAKRSYEYSLILHKLNIQTPEAVAYIELKKGGWLSKSYFINKYEAEYSHIREQMSGNNIPEGFIASLALFVSDMHAKGVLHKDLSPGNILFKKSAKGFDFKVVDINRMNFNKNLTMAERCKCFNRITDNEFILKEIALAYSKLNNFPQKETWDAMLKYNNDFFKR